jgi:hypothetical protein
VSKGIAEEYCWLGLRGDCAHLVAVLIRHIERVLELLGEAGVDAAQLIQVQEDGLDLIRVQQVARLHRHAELLQIKAIISLINQLL